MQPTPAQPRPENTQPRAPSEAERGFTRHIECDGGGYYAAVAEPARGGAMREPSAWRERRPKPRS